MARNKNVSSGRYDRIRPFTFENQHIRARKKKGKERKKMCVKQIWNKERIIEFQNRLKKKDFLARRRHKWDGLSLNLTMNKAIETHSYYRRKRINNWFRRDCKNSRKIREKH